VQVRILLVGVLLAGVALVAAAGPVAGRPREPEAERIARETIAAVRASERSGLVTSLAPAPRRLAVAGPLAGTSYEYDWITKRFVRLPLMAGGGRWYPGATQLGNGDVFVLSGLNGAGALNTQPEIYHPTTRTWSVTPYRLSVPTYPHMLPTAGGRLFFTGVAFGGSAVRVGFLRPLTGSFQPVTGLDTNRRDEGASFFVPFSQGRKVMVAGGNVATHGPGRPVRHRQPGLPGRAEAGQAQEVPVARHPVRRAGATRRRPGPAGQPGVHRPALPSDPQPPGAGDTDLGGPPVSLQHVGGCCCLSGTA
jgi:hypothetical protein